MSGRAPVAAAAGAALVAAVAAVAVVVLCCGFAAAALAAPAPPTSSQVVTPQPILTRPSSQSVPPAGHVLSAREAKRIAAREAKLRKELAEHGRTRSTAFARGRHVWQVSYYAGGEEVAQVVVDERRGEAVAVWTGPQVSWQMARGIPGAFGRRANSAGVWILLCLAFFVPFFDPRRPLRMLHLDLLVLLSFSVSHVFFNRGEIFASVPLVYPVLVYLLVRTLALGFRRPGDGAAVPPAILVPVSWLALGLVFLVGFRIGLNLTSSNVIDVGYSGVIGADRLLDGADVYGAFPAGNPSGDTYGPVNYLAYVPFDLVFPWSGRWDGLPAAHAAALFFDLGTIALLFVAGRRLAGGKPDARAGTRLGLALAYAWAAYPYTLFVSNSNANDSLVALLVVASFVALTSAPARGALLALASAAKFAPLVLAPLYASFDRRRLRDALVFAAAFVAVAALAIFPVLPDGGLRETWDRTVGFQLGRDSPFSIWGQVSWLEPFQFLAKATVIALAAAVAIYPRRKTALQVAALGAAVLIALQLSLSHWFYLYIVWWFPLAIIALLAREPSPTR